MTDIRTIKCRARGGATMCVDPNCPEKVASRAALLADVIAFPVAKPVDAGENKRINQDIANIVGERPNVEELEGFLNDLEGMGDSHAQYIYGSLAYKAKLQQRVFDLFYTADTK